MRTNITSDLMSMHAIQFISLIKSLSLEQDMMAAAHASHNPLSSRSLEASGLRKSLEIWHTKTQLELEGGNHPSHDPAYIVGSQVCLVYCQLCPWLPLWSYFGVPNLEHSILNLGWLAAIWYMILAKSSGAQAPVACCNLNPKPDTAQIWLT